MNKKTLSSLQLALLLLLVTFSSVSARAAGGINVAPAYVTVSLSSQQPLQEASVGVRNDFDKPIDMTAGLRAVDQSSGSLSQTTKVDPVLEKLISIEPQTFTLQPKQSINIKLSFKDDTRLSPGGHYAALLLRQINTGSGVGIQPAVAVNLFIIKEDGAQRSLAVGGVRLPGLAFWLPKKIDLTVSNTGNVLVTPRLSLSMAQNDRVITSAAVNDSSQSVFPGRSLAFSPVLKSRTFSWLPGKYSLVVRYRDDGSAAVKTAVYDFWYLPWQYLAIIGLSIVVIYWQRHRLKRAYKRLRTYKFAQKTNKNKD